MTGNPWELLPTVRTVAELEEYGLPEPPGLGPVSRVEARDVAAHRRTPYAAITQTQS